MPLSAALYEYHPLVTLIFPTQLLLAVFAPIGAIRCHELRRDSIGFLPVPNRHKSNFWNRWSLETSLLFRPPNLQYHDPSFVLGCATRAKDRVSLLLPRNLSSFDLAVGRREDAEEVPP